MSLEEPPVALRNALRLLASQARNEAALLDVSDPEHAFYTGVVAAAEDRLHPQASHVHDESWLAREPQSFREGYLKAGHVIAHAGPDMVRLMLPTYDRV
jgi:hypothetical protein